ncbi:MAG: twin-arginine translocase subunit TatC [Bryobacteraceae bacterium]
MSSSEENKGAQAPEGGSPPEAGEQETREGAPARETTDNGTDSAAAAAPAPEVSEPAESASEDPDPYRDDSYNYNEDYPSYEEPRPETAVATAAAGAAPPAKPPEPDEDEEIDPDEEGMLRMSFLEHLEELRVRLIRCLYGIGVAFVVSLVFAENLWLVVSAPAAAALESLGLPPNLVAITPMEQFNTIWVKLPILTSIFLASPWVLYQAWAFIAPGLYKKERRWAAPFVLISASLFIGGGLFAYFVAFRFGLTFLLGIGRGVGVVPMVSITEYFDLFVNVTLGIALVFELPVLIFFLTLLRIVTPRFLLSNSRYAILVIVILAAIITPTPDVINLSIFAAPMILLYFVGVFASYVLFLHRENQAFPWKKFGYFVLVVAAMAAVAVTLAITKYGYKLVLSWPFFIR